jgi:transcriptional regulator with XRE-family HTH domain
MADPVTFRLHRLGDRPQRLSLTAQSDHFADRLLLGLMRHELAVVAAPEPERNLPAEIATARLLVGLHLPDPLPNAITLGLSKGCGDGQEQLGQAIAGDVAAQVEQMELDAPALQALHHLERVVGRTLIYIDSRICAGNLVYCNEMGIMMAISPLQLKMARAALKWGVRTLAEKAGISPDTVTRAEQGDDVTVKTWGAIQRAFEEDGIEFLPEANSVSLHADVAEAAICVDPEMPLGIRRIYPRCEAHGVGPYEISIVRLPLPRDPLGASAPANVTFPINPHRARTEMEALALCRGRVEAGYGVVVTGPYVYWDQAEVVRRLNSTATT